MTRLFLSASLVVPLVVQGADKDEAPLLHVGAARIDITPELPIRLTGYSGRPGEAERVERRLYARALVIGDDEDRPAVLMAVELIGLTAEITDSVARALQQTHGIERNRFTICNTHVHSGPAVRGVLPFMFAGDLAPDELQRIDHYTDVLIEKLVKVAAAALADRRPGRIGWNEGTVGFAAQRRRVVDGKWVRGGWYDPDGSVDRVLPLMRVTDEDGGLRAIFTSYACHCTAIGGADNFVHSDWAGEASARIEAGHDGAVALVALGCGADANPHPRGSLETAKQHGETLAAEVERLLMLPFRPLGPVTVAAFRESTLTFDHAVTREELEERVRVSPKSPRVYAASKFLQVLDAGGELPATVPYPVQAWIFGNDLAMVFLGGEVVSEYSLRLRRELDASRLWINAYANDVACYLPSRRMFDEGGYEVDGAMDFYGLPTRLSVGTEDQVIAEARRLIPAEFVRRK